MELFRRLGPGDESQLADFFYVLLRSGAEKTFHPHPLDAKTASKICGHSGTDFYGAFLSSSGIRGYGMLRGFDAGFDIPSLGIAIHPAHRGKGMGRALMDELHATAKALGANQIRLKVYASNKVAVSLYQRIGYRFDEVCGDQIIGICQL